MDGPYHTLVTGETQPVQVGEVLKYFTIDFKESDLGRAVSVRGDSFTLYDWEKHRFVKASLKDVE